MMMKRSSKRNQNGVTLVELMVAGVVGAIVTIFIADVMISGSRTAIQSEGVSQAQENARFISTWLQSRVRSAGYAGLGEDERITPLAQIEGILGSTCSLALPPAINADCIINTDSDDSDRLAIRRAYFDNPNDPVGTVTDKMRSCSGVELTGMNNGDVLVDVYWTGNSGAANGLGYDDNLFCITYEESTRLPHTDDPSPTAIANGVLGFHVLYGVSANSDNSQIEQYVSADQLQGNLRERVRSIRFAILTRAFSDQGLDVASRAYVLLDSDTDTFVFNDAVPRHSISTTVFLPNE